MQATNNEASVLCTRVEHNHRFVHVGDVWLRKVNFWMYIATGGTAYSNQNDCPVSYHAAPEFSDLFCPEVKVGRVKDTLGTELTCATRAQCVHAANPCMHEANALRDR